MGLSRRHGELLEARGLEIEMLERLGVSSCEKLGPDTIAIPYTHGGQVVGVKYRTIAGEKRFAQEPGSRQIFYNRDCLDDPTLSAHPVVITEGEVDCWTAMQSGFGRVSVPAGAPATAVGERSSAKYGFIDDMPAAIDAPEFIIAVDTDEPGGALRADLALRLNAKRCRWTRYPVGCKDLNETLQQYGQRAVVLSINRSQWMVGNVYRMSDIPPVAEAVPHDSGFPGLEAHYKLRLGDLAVVTGVPMSGKSTFIGDLACRMALRHKWPVCFASFEQEPTHDHRRQLRKWFGGGIVGSLDEETLSRADKWIDDTFSFIVPDDDSNATLKWVMERMAVSALRYGSRLFVLDPWNEVEHDRPEGMSLTEYTGQALREFRKFARKYEAHMIVAAHPAKMRRDQDGNYPIPSLYDISDSAHWYNRPDVGIVVHRKTEDETLIRVAKSRYHDQIGRPGDVSVRYVWQRATYEGIGPTLRDYTEPSGGNR